MSADEHAGLPVHTLVPAMRLPHGEGFIERIVESPEHEAATEMFSKHPFWQQSMISFNSLSMLYSIVRGSSPEYILEIGSFKGRTSYAMAHALATNGKGLLYTLGPYDSHHFLPAYENWPPEIRERIQFCPINSAEFFSDPKFESIRFDIVFVDGNHDYEYALFDILEGAKRTVPGGLIVIDNISQAGPMYAVLDFLKANQNWTDCGVGPTPAYPKRAFDRSRANIPGSDFMIIRAPSRYTIGERAITFGAQKWHTNVVRGVVFPGAERPIFCQCVLRSFGPERLYEVVTEGEGTGVMEFARPLIVGENDHYTVELWGVSTGGQIELSGLPAPF